MQFFLSVFSAGVVLTFLVFHCDASPLKSFGDSPPGLEKHEKENGGANERPGPEKLKESPLTEEDDSEDQDFHDEEELINLNDPDAPGVDSVTHFHTKDGEILVPCFGMWWPVGGNGGYGGGGGGGYEYVDYYDDEGRRARKRRRSKKQKKAAKMKKKKA